MDIKNQVCSVEQAKRIKELGVDQTKSYFYYYLGDTAINIDRLLTRVYGSDGTGQLGASAFTVAELHQMLPYSILDEKGDEFILSVTKDYDHHSESVTYTCGYYNFHKHDWHYGVGDYSTALAAAELLIRLIENGKTIFSEVNERLAS